jgi:hypothetical protein
MESVFNLLAKKIEVIAVHLFSAKAKLAVTEPSESQKELMLALKFLALTNTLAIESNLMESRLLRLYFPEL